MAAAADDLRPAQAVVYEPRAAFLPFHLRSQRWAVLVAHRRAGKTVACVAELITRALATPKTNARYAYIAPYREQAKTVAWEYLKHYALPVTVDPETDFRESDLTVRLFNGSVIRLYGADNPNALRGIYLDGVVLDEFADMRPELWRTVIRPALSDRRGWAVFIGTPRGRNEFWQIYDNSTRDEAWFSLLLKASETGLIAADELADARKSMTANAFEQEYECSFDAAIIGAIYAKELLGARARGNIGRVAYDPTKLVHTAWDIGYGDSTAIWFWQPIDGELRLIDYYEANGEPITSYMQVLAGRGYKYDTLWMPHDAENKSIVSGQSVCDILRKAGFRVRMVPKLSLEDGINAARLVFGRVRIDETRCAAGIEALQHYRWGWNDRLDEPKPTPIHDWSSHGADAWRYFALAAKAEPEKREKPLRIDTRGIV
jgi:hypothetical protein